MNLPSMRTFLTVAVVTLVVMWAANQFPTLKQITG